VDIGCSSFAKAHCCSTTHYAPKSSITVSVETNEQNKKRIKKQYVLQDSLFFFFFFFFLIILLKKSAWGQYYWVNYNKL
jgi:hypothetical protein